MPKSDLSLYSSEELINELEKRNAYKLQRDSINRIRDLNINGITSKNFIIKYGDLVGIGKTQYSFYLIHNNKEYDIYYDSRDENGKLLDWWPVMVDDNEKSDIVFDFVPTEFSEDCENLYSFCNKNVKQVLEFLRKCGFKQFKKIE